VSKLAGYRQILNSLETMKKITGWIPSIILMLLMFLLLSAVRVYVGPDDLLFVWKGDLSFADTVVNLDDYTAGVTINERAVIRSDLANRNPELLAQMEDMGLLTDEAQAIRKRHKARRAGAKGGQGTATDTKAGPGAKTEPAVAEPTKAEPAKTGT
jgi:hypothetical protein